MDWQALRQELVAAGYELHSADSLLVLGSDKVMALGETTALLDQASRPSERVGRALDLGCGAGTLALLLAGKADQVFGVDIDPAAIELAKVNAAMNGIQGIEWRVGDLFEPLKDEWFDLIIAQLPFLPYDASGPRSLIKHGGERGDELCLRALSELGEHMRIGGRAFFLLDWSIVEGETISARICGALGDRGWKVLLLLSPEIAPAAHGYGESMGLRGIRQSILAVERCDCDGWLNKWDVPAESWRAIRRERIDEIFASYDAPPDCEVRWAAGATLEERTVIEHPALRERRIVFDREALLAPLPWNGSLDLTPELRVEGLRRGWLRRK